MREARFRDHFWSTDLTSTVGYDSIIQHLNDGRKNCKEFEDFLKERAIIEEKYGKELINLSKKKPCGQTELNTLKRSLDVFKQQVDNVGQGHIQLAQTLREEAKKMEEFREKQKLHRKKIELIMDAIHKNRNLQYKKTMEAKRLYEQRCRDKDEAEQAVHRNANLVTQKQQEKLFLKLAQTKSALEDSDRSYQQNVTTLEKIREEWQKEHIKACEFFETQECERISYFRNALWLHVNQLSQDCVQNDEKYEEIRKSLEMCSIEKDIDFFVNLRKTGNLAPAPVVYENYYNAERNVAPARSPVPVPISRRGPLPTPTSAPGRRHQLACLAEGGVSSYSQPHRAEVLLLHFKKEIRGFSSLRKSSDNYLYIQKMPAKKICAFDQQTPWMDFASSRSGEGKEYKQWTWTQILCQKKILI
ncbi:proline-serine-threonine phosphatase-interacting protein 2 isoform X1 [Calypte anna]|uniref:proline-serine-threonine phosphatase-interacting protein 2 isoform X1 n=1 Tax=Calypte anna TaxID=9244 RepID=UPI0011C3B9CB|nr:proline-serine-threonine phosphatase-interacting protein 2 isoform X1 [Calypte anna]